MIDDETLFKQVIEDILGQKVGTHVKDDLLAAIMDIVDPAEDEATAAFNADAEAEKAAAEAKKAAEEVAKKKEAEAKKAAEAKKKAAKAKKGGK